MSFGNTIIMMNNYMLKVRRLCAAAGLLEFHLADHPIIDVTKKNEFWKYNNYDE